MLLAAHVPWQMATSVSRAGLLLLILLLFLLATGGRVAGENSGAVNTAALDRVKKKKEWRAAAPDGCKPSGEGAKGRWCELHEDSSITLRNAKRLDRALTEAHDRAKGSAQDFEPSGADIAAHRLKESVLIADKAYAAKEKKRRAKFMAEQKRKGNASKPPAEKVPTTYRCRKEEKCPPGLKKCFPDVKVFTLESLSYKCTVTDYTFREDEVAERAKKETAAPKERCKELRRWQRAFDKDGSKSPKTGERTHAKFFRELEKQSKEVGMLAKLRVQVGEEGVSGKVVDAMEKKAKALYKTLSKAVHPDRVPAECATEVIPVAKAVFDHAAKLETCVRKPLRCELPPVQGSGEGQKSRFRSEL